MEYYGDTVSFLRVFDDYVWFFDSYIHPGSLMVVTTEDIKKLSRAQNKLVNKIIKKLR